jgi:hypothetical protein
MGLRNSNESNCFTKGQLIRQCANDQLIENELIICTSSN